MKFLRLLLVASLACAGAQVQAYGRAKEPKKTTDTIGVLWIKKDKGIQYALLAKVQEGGGFMGKADIVSYTEPSQKMEKNIKVFAQAPGLTIFERKVTAWKKPSMRWDYSWVALDDLKSAAREAYQSKKYTGFRVKTRAQEKEGRSYTVELCPKLLEALANSFGAESSK